VNNTGRAWLAGIVVLAFVGAEGCQKNTSTEDGIVELNQGQLEVSGPFVYENLAVFLIHSDQNDDREYITLDQGLKDDVVKVSEKKQAQVQELEIDNQSDKYLFLQEGDRVSGGQQDRIIITSLVVPPKSGKMPLPSFCVEEGRWHGQAGFGATANAALAPKEVRQASKVFNEQGRVWQSVRGLKVQACSADGVKAPNTNTSLNETLDSPQVKQLSDKCTEALRGVLNEHPSAVGLAVVVNGSIEEVNVYPNGQLLGKLYPRLLQSYALQAALTKDKAKDAKEISAHDVRAFLSERQEQGKAKSREVDHFNTLCVHDEAKKYQCETLYEGKVVHRQWLSKDPGSPAREHEMQAEPPNEAPARR
jgi:hypothetical protein